jgi:ribose 5-phosphate isomerase B
LPPTEAEVREIVLRVLSRLAESRPDVLGAGPGTRNPGVAAPPARSGGRTLIDESVVRDLAPGSRLVVPRGAVITPLARQIAQERNVLLDDSAPAPTVRTPAQSKAGAQQRVAIGADHGGYPLKETLKAQLQNLGYEVVDCGTTSTDAVDYPDFAYAVAQLVAGGQCANGIMIDGAGIGSCITANKVPGVRAAMCYDHATAVNSREHNHANVLTLGAGLIGANLAKQILQTWLATPYGGGRHAARVQKIVAIEKRFTK